MFIEFILDNFSGAIRQQQQQQQQQTSPAQRKRGHSGPSPLVLSSSPTQMRQQNVMPQVSMNRNTQWFRGDVLLFASSENFNSFLV